MPEGREEMLAVGELADAVFKGGKVVTGRLRGWLCARNGALAALDAGTILRFSESSTLQQSPDCQRTQGSFFALRQKEEYAYTATQEATAADHA